MTRQGVTESDGSASARASYPWTRFTGDLGLGASELGADVFDVSETTIEKSQVLVIESEIM